MGNEQSNNSANFYALFMKNNNEVLETTGVSNGEEPTTGELLDQRRRTAHKNRARRTTFQMPSPDEQYTKKVQLQVPLTKIRLSIEERLDGTPRCDDVVQQQDDERTSDDQNANEEGREEKSDYFRHVRKNTKKYTKKYIKKGKKAVRKGISKLNNSKLLNNIRTIQKLTYHSVFHSTNHSSEHHDDGSHNGNIGVTKSPWKASESVPTSPQLATSESKGDSFRWNTHRRSLSSDSSSVESSIALRVKNIPVGASRASYVHPRIQNLKVQGTSQASSLGTTSFDTHTTNPYGAHGGLRLDKIISICSTITDDFTPRQGKGGPKFDKSALSVIKQFRSFDEQSDAMPETPIGFDHLAEYDYQESLLKLQSTPASECSEAYESNYFFESSGLPAVNKSAPSHTASSRESSLLEKYLMTKRSMQERLATEAGGINHSASLKSSTSALPPKAYNKADRSTNNFLPTQNTFSWRIDDDTYNDHENSHIETENTSNSLRSSPLYGLQHGASPTVDVKNLECMNNVHEAESIDDSSIPLFSKKIEYVNKAQEEESVISFLTNSIFNTESFERETIKLGKSKMQLVEEVEDDKNVSSQMTQNEAEDTEPRGAHKSEIGYSPRAFAPKGSAFGVQLRRVANPKIDTAVPLIGDGIFPNNTDTGSQPKDDQPQAPVTDKDRMSEMRRLLPISNFSTPATPKNIESARVNMFNGPLERAGSEESLENISESPSEAKRLSRLSKSSVKPNLKRASPPKRRPWSAKVERRSSGMVAQRVSEINKRTSEGAGLIKGVTDYNGRLKKNRNVKYRNERRETNGEGVLAPRKGTLKNPLFCTPLVEALSGVIAECKEEDDDKLCGADNQTDCEEGDKNIKEIKNSSNLLTLSNSGDQLQDILQSESADSAVDCFDQELTKHIEDLEEAMNNLEVYERPKNRSGFFSPQQQEMMNGYNDVDSAQGSVVSDVFAAELANGFVGKKVLLGDFNKEEESTCTDEHGVIFDNSGGALPPRPPLLRNMSVNSATMVLQSGTNSGHNSFGDCSPLSTDNPSTPCDKENSSSHLSSTPFRTQDSSSVNPQKMNIPGTPRELCLSPTQRTPHQASKWRQMAAKHGTAERSSSKKLRRSRLALDKVQSLL
jgi:hypothetical protein